MSTLRVNSIENTGGVDLFANSKTPVGYQKLPSGLIIQWGRVGCTLGTGGSTSYAIPFPTQLLSMSVSLESASGQGWLLRSSFTNDTAAKSGFSWAWDNYNTAGQGSAGFVNYIAIGY